MMDLTFSERATNNACEYKWYLTYIKLLTSKTPQAPLEDGSVFHNILYNYYDRMSLPNLANLIRDDYKVLISNLRVPKTQELMEKYETRMINLQGMIFGYDKVFHEEIEEWETIEAEKEFAVEVISKSPKVSFIHRGKRDRVIRRKDGTKSLVEFKTTSRLDSNYINRLKMDTQVQTYLWADWRMSLISGEKMCDDITYRIIKKPSIRQKKGETREEFLQRLMAEYKEFPEKYFHTEILRFNKKILYQFERDLIKHARKIARATKKPKLEITRDTARCNDYGPCPFMSICLNRNLKGSYMDQFYTRENKHNELNERKKEDENY